METTNYEIIPGLTRENADAAIALAKSQGLDASAVLTFTTGGGGYKVPVVADAKPAKKKSSPAKGAKAPVVEESTEEVVASETGPQKTKTAKKE